ncbi:MAG TPA: hypothetical protein VF011_21960 [Terriglobales bacterium]
MPNVPLPAQFFWIASVIVQLAVAVVLIRRRLHREFPVFFAYTIFRASTSAAMFLLYREHFYVGHLYGYTNLVHETGCIILRFAVIYELFVAVLGRYPTLRDSAGPLFRWGTAALLVIAVTVAIYHKLGPNGNVFDAALNLMDRTADIIQCGLLLALLVFSRYLRLTWRNYAFGIAAGLGIFATVDLATAAILMESRNIPPEQQYQLAIKMDLISMAGYLFCVLIWLAYALLPEPAAQVAEQIPEHDLASWDHELERLLQR